MIKTGELDTLITIQQPTTTQNAIGEPVRGSWSTFHQAWAHVIPVYASERFQSNERHAVRAAKFVIRYIDGVTEQMRIQHAGDVYEITGVAPIGRRDGLQITGEAVL